MVQTGDPTGTGKGGTSIWGGKFSDEITESLKHNTRGKRLSFDLLYVVYNCCAMFQSLVFNYLPTGIVSMANSGPNTNGSQFFITYGAQDSLDLKYTIFGKVIDGFDSLDELEKLQVTAKHRPINETRLR